MAKKQKKVLTGYYPRPFQEMLHKQVGRFNVLVCHRRFGKTIFSINEMVDRALRNPKSNPRYAYIAPTYQQVKRIAWDEFKKYTRNIPGFSVHETELRIDINRPDRGDFIRFYLLSAENPDGIRGIYLDGVILDEYAQCHPSIWNQVVRPTLSDRKGWAIFIGTPKGQNHFWDRYQIAKQNPKWFTAVFKASETGILDSTELDDARADMSEEEFLQEYECSFTAAMTGSYYGKVLQEIETKGQITRVPFDPALPVDTYWDLGIGDSTAVWFVQNLRSERHVIDYLENSGESLSWYIKALKDDHRKEYNYREHYMPHDAEAREFQTGKSRKQSFYDLTRHMPRVLPRHNVDDGIDEVRKILKTCWIDEEKCKRGIDALRHYQKKWDEKNKFFSTKPKHDWSSHGADAFRTFAMAHRQEGDRMDNRHIPRQAETDYDIFDY